MHWPESASGDFGLQAWVSGYTVVDSAEVLRLSLLYGTMGFSMVRGALRIHDCDREGGS